MYFNFQSHIAFKMKVIIGITGASGSIYAQRLINKLINSGNKISEIALVISPNGKQVYEYEVGEFKFKNEKIKEHKFNDFFSPIASGSSKFDAMVIIPSSMGTLAKIANGIADNVLIRAADVMLKEQRKLIIVARETPLNLIHIENMKKIVQAGGIVLPASPSFYSKPKNIEELVDTVLDRILDILKIENKSFRWGE
ncbi:MAG: UbiX family flavin prenyltransferase [Bacteroidales bacterium]|nr:UbiX family flavin prenyltransferase [Bacteroidales bacterium]